MMVTFHNFKRIHLVGIGGIGMSGIAEVLLTLGYAVSGSDPQPPPITERLQNLGAQIYEGHQRRTSARRARGGDHFRGRPPTIPKLSKPRTQNPGDPARRNAGRTDAPEIRHRRGRRARQDHHHLDGRRRSWPRGSRSHLCRRRPRESGRHHGASRQRRLHGGRSRRKRPHAFCCWRRWSPWSPPSTASTSISTPRSRRFRTSSRSSSIACRSTARPCFASTSPTCKPSFRASRARSSPTASPARPTWSSATSILRAWIAISGSPIKGDDLGMFHLPHPPGIHNVRNAAAAAAVALYLNVPADLIREAPRKISPAWAAALKSRASSTASR